MQEDQSLCVEFNKIDGSGLDFLDIYTNFQSVLGPVDPDAATAATDGQDENQE